MPAAQTHIAQLYQEHHGWLFDTLRRRLGGDTHQAADLAHDTFERLIKAGTAACLIEPRAYLTTIASRLTANHYRRLALEQRYLQALAQHPQAVQPSEEDRALVFEALNSISRILDGLSVRARTVFLLAQLDGLPYRTIAEQLNLTLNIVQKDMIKAITHCYQAVYA